MKTLSLLFIATLVFANSFTSPQESAELKEATTLTDSSIKLFNQGKYDQAIPQAKRALQIREKLLPRTDPRVVDSLSNLGEFYISMQDYKAAIEVFRRMLLSQEERFGAEHVNVANTLDRLAILYSAAGNFREAEAAYKRALALREKDLERIASRSRKRTLRWPIFTVRAQTLRTPRRTIAVRWQSMGKSQVYHPRIGNAFARGSTVWAIRANNSMFRRS